MADVTIEATAQPPLDGLALRGGVFWTSPTVGYVIYTDSNWNLAYRKTVNGGANWGGKVIIHTGHVVGYDSWADWQTAGDAGTKIHIVYIDNVSDDVRYVYLDTSTDTVGGDDLIEACQGSGTMLDAEHRGYYLPTITKTRGGNLAVAFRYADNTMTHFYSFYTSPDAAAWTSEASPWEAAADYILLFPGNEADNQDVWAAFWDLSADEISLKTYDDSGNSWSAGTLISAMDKGLGSYYQMDGQVRLSDGHLIFAAWNERITAAADLMTWDINGEASITAKANVITNENETFLVSVFVNQINDDIYIAYASGTDAENFVKVFYQKSVNGAANWGGEQAMQANAEDDERWISAGAMNAAWGGKFQPFWFNEDLVDLFTNAANGISIAVPAAAPVGGGGLAAAAKVLLT